MISLDYAEWLVLYMLPSSGRGVDAAVLQQALERYNVSSARIAAAVAYLLEIEAIEQRAGDRVAYVLDRPCADVPVRRQVENRGVARGRE